MQLPLQLCSALVILSLTWPPDPLEPQCKHGAHGSRVAILPVQEQIPTGYTYCRFQGPVFSVRQSSSTFFDSSGQYAFLPRVEFGQLEDAHATSCFELISRYASACELSAAPVLQGFNKSVVLARWQGDIAPYQQTELIPDPGPLHLRRSPCDHFELTWNGAAFQLQVFRKVKLPPRCVVNPPAAELDEIIDLKARRFEDVLVLEPDKMRGLIPLFVVIESNGTASVAIDATFPRGIAMPVSVVSPNWKLQFETDSYQCGVAGSSFFEADLSPVWPAPESNNAIGKSSNTRHVQAVEQQGQDHSPAFGFVASDPEVQRRWASVR